MKKIIFNRFLQVVISPYKRESLFIPKILYGLGCQTEKEIVHYLEHNNPHLVKLETFNKLCYMIENTFKVNPKIKTATLLPDTNIEPSDKIQLYSKLVSANSDVLVYLGQVTIVDKYPVSTNKCTLTIKDEKLSKQRNAKEIASFAEKQGLTTNQFFLLYPEFEGFCVSWE